MNQQYKVLTLLEWRVKKASRAIKHISDVRTKAWQIPQQAIDGIVKQFITRELEIDQFYAQSFTPELIPQLFEGWEEEDRPFEDDPRFYSKEGEELCIGLDLEETPSLQMEIFGNNSAHNYFIRPANLADFISDCTRAGLVLYWREEVVEKNSFLK